MSKRKRRESSGSKTTKRAKSGRKPLAFEVNTGSLDSYPRLIKLLAANTDDKKMNSRWLGLHDIIRTETIPSGKEGKKPTRNSSTTLTQILNGDPTTEWYQDHKGFVDIVGCKTDTKCLLGLFDSWIQTFKTKVTGIPPNSASQQEKITAYMQNVDLPDELVKKITDVLDDLNTFLPVLYASQPTNNSYKGMVKDHNNAIKNHLYNGFQHWKKGKLGKRLTFHLFPAGGTSNPKEVRDVLISQADEDRKRLSRRLANLVYVDEPVIIQNAMEWGQVIFDQKMRPVVDEEVDDLRAAWLQLMTGCRSIELYYEEISKFIAYADITDTDAADIKAVLQRKIGVDYAVYGIRQIGVAKDRHNPEGDDNGRPVDKPVLRIQRSAEVGDYYTAEDVLAQLYQLRANTNLSAKVDQIMKDSKKDRAKKGRKGVTVMVKDIKSLRSGMVGHLSKKVYKVVRSGFKLFTEDYSRLREGHPLGPGTHVLRKIYLNYSYYLYGQGKYDRTYFVSLLGGWKPQSGMSTSHSYTDIRVRPRPPASDAESERYVQRENDVIVRSMKREAELSYLFENQQAEIAKLWKKLQTTNVKRKEQKKNIKGSGEPRTLYTSAIKTARENKSDDITIQGVIIPLTYNARGLTAHHKRERLKAAADALAKLVPRISISMLAATGFGKRAVKKYLNKYYN